MGRLHSWLHAAASSARPTPLLGRALGRCRVPPPAVLSASCKCTAWAAHVAALGHGPRSGGWCGTGSMPGARPPPQQHAMLAGAATEGASSSGAPSRDGASSSSSSSSSSGEGPARAHMAAYREALRAAGASEAQRRQLEEYLDFMLERNKVMNLTAVRDRSEALVRHIADSLALLPVVERHVRATSTPAGPQGAAAPTPPQQGLRVIDVGTGAGLPGVVLAIMRPQWQVTLLDSLRKRCDFLSEVVTVTGLRNVRVVWGRAEEGGRRSDLREAHDVAVARAVADMRVLSELCLPFVRAGGLWIAAKGPEPQAEVAAASKALQLLRGQLVGVEAVASFSPDGQRTAVVVYKQGGTPPKFPRAPGTPGKSPL